MYFAGIGTSGFVMGAIKTVEPPVSGGLSPRNAAFMQGLRDAIDARIDDIRNDLFRAASLMSAVRSHQTNPWRGDTMSTELTELHAKLRSKTREILTLVANSYGLGAVSSLEPSRLEQLNEEVEEIIEQHDEALNEGETSEEWRALDERLARTEIGRLLQERHEIAEQILDAEDDDD